jgi:hypothetical protein
MIPVRARRGKVRMTVARQHILFALNNQFRVCESVVIAGVVDVEMSADESIDVGRVQAHPL